MQNNYDVEESLTDICRVIMKSRRGLSDSETHMQSFDGFAVEIRLCLLASSSAFFCGCS